MKAEEPWNPSTIKSRAAIGCVSVQGSASGGGAGVLESTMTIETEALKALIEARKAASGGTWKVHDDLNTSVLSNGFTDGPKIVVRCAGLQCGPYNAQFATLAANTIATHGPVILARLEEAERVSLALKAAMAGLAGVRSALDADAKQAAEPFDPGMTQIQWRIVADQRLHKTLAEIETLLKARA
jgi:hypothetical protein